MVIRTRAASSKGTVSSVPAWFRADSGTNLIKQGEIAIGRPCDSVAQWSECSHGLREVLGSSPGRAMCFFLLCDIWVRVPVGPCAFSSPVTYQIIPNVTGEEKAHGPTGTRTPKCLWHLLKSNINTNAVGLCLIDFKRILFKFLWHCV